MRFSIAIFGNQPLPRLIEQARLAERLGYCGVWFTDTQLTCREVYVTLAACALKTSRVVLGTGVTMPHTRHASVTASAFASLNEIAEGRLQLGISIGDNGLKTIGRPMARIAELEAYVAQLRGLLGNQPVEFDAGQRGKITWLSAPTGIPIHVAATGPRLTRAAGRIGDGAILLRPITPERMGEGVRIVREEAQRAGKDPARVPVRAWVQSAVGEDRAKARRHAQGLVAEILQMCHIDMFEEADRDAIRAIKRDYDFYAQNELYGEARAPIPEKFVEMFAFAGDAEEVREKVEALMRVEGLDEIMVAPQNQEGSPGPGVEEVIRVFAEGVMHRV